MIGIVPVDGGRITGVEPAEDGGAITPVSGIGRAVPLSASGFSLLGCTAGPELLGGTVGASDCGLTTSGTGCPCAVLSPKPMMLSAVAMMSSPCPAGRVAA
ncbi:MAG: hypothetical protein ACRYGM_01300 [Janthinobacterium lividum]